jgi:predicted DsbA family dithiol-disulfide isomerase
VAQGIQGVPCLVIGGKFFLVGAQEKQAILQQIDTYYQALQSALDNDTDPSGQASPA